MNIEILKQIMSEKKTRLPLLRSQDWKTVKTETENKQIFNTYLIKQQHRIKWNNLCKSKISLDGKFDWKHW